MKRTILIISALFCFVSASAQVLREVEVTKQYAPKLPPARKLEITTNKLDTVAIRPEIDYTVSPKSFKSALTAEKFRPATVTYWEYDRQYPFYLKAGVGFPLSSQVDFYASTHRADVGYLTGYVNHLGQFANIKVEDPFSGSIYDNNSQQMINRVGVNGGKYIGRYTFDGDIYYQSDIYHRYPQQSAEDMLDEINYENAALSLKFGDSFADLSKVNFSLYASADMYNDKSEPYIMAYDGRKLQQISTNAGAKIARKIGNRGELSAFFDYQGYYGLQDLKEYDNNIISAGFVVGYCSAKMFNMNAGLSYSYDNLPLATVEAKHHILPYLYLGLNVKDNGIFVPYIEVDSKLINNSYQQLQRTNPYILLLGDNIEAKPNTVIYNARFGFTGHTKNCKLAYRLYANMSFIDNALYWYNYNLYGFDAVVGRQNVWSVNASVEYKPISSLFMSLGFKGMVYTDFVTEVDNCKPSYMGDLKIGYTHRKFAVSLLATLVGDTKWTMMYSDTEAIEQLSSATISYPAYVDLGLMFDWYVSKQWTVFVEGKNLANANIYQWANYRQYGIAGMVGVKVQF